MPIMPRIRTIKPEFFMHEGLFDLAQKHPLPIHLAFMGLIACSDKEGRFCWEVRRLKATILPYYDVDMSEVLEIFVENGFIRKYQHQGSWYGCIPSWLKHQRIKNEEDSILPPPDAPNWVKPEPKAASFETPEAPLEEKSQPPILEPFLGSPPPEIENKNSIKNNNLQELEPLSPRAHARRFCARVEGKGKEVKGSEEKKTGEQNNIVVSDAGSAIADPVLLIFKHWQTVMEHPHAKLDSERKLLIQRALKLGYSTDELCKAIQGCSITPHNRGENDRGERYDGLHIIFGSSEKIERFMRYYEKPPKSKTESQKRTESNIHTLQNWINAKMQEKAVYARA